MATIRNLTIRNLTDGRGVPIQSIEGDVTISELIDAYRTALGIPNTQQLELRRKSTNQQLKPNLTIQSAGIQDNETLIAEATLVAG